MRIRPRCMCLSYCTSRWPGGPAPYRAKNLSYGAKNCRKTEKLIKKKRFLTIFNGIWEVAELWQGLVLYGMGEVDFHVFWKYWKLTSSPNTSKLVLGPPDWSSDFFESQGTISGAIKPIIFPKNDPKRQICFGNLGNHQKSLFCDKMASLFLVLGFFVRAPCCLLGPIVFLSSVISSSICARLENKKFNYIWPGSLGRAL